MQIYAEFEVFDPSVDHRIKEPCGFAKVELEPNAEEMVMITVSPEE